MGTFVTGDQVVDQWYSEIKKHDYNSDGAMGSGQSLIICLSVCLRLCLSLDLDLSVPNGQTQFSLRHA